MHLIAHYVLKMCAKHEYFTTTVKHQKAHLIKLINMRRKEINCSKQCSSYFLNLLLFLQVHRSSLTFSDETKTRRDKKRQHRSLSNRFFLLRWLWSRPLNYILSFISLESRFIFKFQITSIFMLIYEPDSFIRENIL